MGSQGFAFCFFRDEFPEIGPMPGEVEKGDKTHADTEIYMPYDEAVDQRHFQFVIYLYGKYNAQDGCGEEGEKEGGVPELSILRRIEKSHSAEDKCEAVHKECGEAYGD